MPWYSQRWWCLDIMPGRHTRAGRRSPASYQGYTVLPAAWRQTGSPVTHRHTGVRSSGAGCSWHELWHQTTELRAGGVQGSLSVSTKGKAAGMQEWAIGGSQVRAPSQQWADGGARRGATAAFVPGSRPSHLETCPCPHISPSVVCTPGSSQSKSTG